jgi:VWFA-related protein
MTNPILARAVLAVAVVVLSAAPGAREGQPPATSQVEGPRFGISTAAVVVDVMVRDKKGNPVTDLTKDQFEVFEDGVPQAVTDFERVMPGVLPTTLQNVAPSVSSTAAATVHEPAERNARLQGQQVTAIVFDWLTEQPRYEAWKAASTLLGQMAADDYVAIYVIDQELRRIVPYTRNAAMLKAAFDIAVARPFGNPTVPRSAALNSLVNQRDLPDTASAEYAAGANTLNSASTDTRGPASAMAAMLERELQWNQFMNRQQQGRAVSSGLTALVEQLGEMPGRKTVIFFSEGLVVTERSKSSFDAMEHRANRNNVSFYTIDAAGLRVFSVSRSTYQQLGPTGEQGVARGISDDPTARRTELMWRDPSLGLRPLAERTGGIYIGDTNDIVAGFARVNSDRKFHYLLAYSSSNPAPDGTFRKIEVKVKRPGVEVKARSGYVALPAPESPPAPAYEGPALSAIASSPPPTAFPVRARALSVPMPDSPSLTALIASFGSDAVTFVEDAGTSTFAGEATVLARAVDASGAPIAKRSQQYQLTGAVADLPKVRSGAMMFFRTADLRSGAYTVDFAVHDVRGSRSSVVSTPLEVPGAATPVVGSLFVISRVERLDPRDLSAATHPLAGSGVLLYPSMGEPISRKSQAEIAFALPMVVDPWAAPPTATLQLLRQGQSLAQLPVPLDQPDPTGRLLQVSRLPSAAVPPGTYELRLTVTAGASRAVRSTPLVVVD